MNPLFRITALLSVISTLVGCTTVGSTSAYYRPMTTELYPQKPDDFPIPILGAAPNRPYYVIGRISFRAGEGIEYVNEALKYNARKNGADAVVIIEEGSETAQKSYYVPGYTTTTPVTTHSSGTVNYYGYGGYGSGNVSGSSTTYVPTYHPGHSGSRPVTIQTVDAAMIRYK